MTRLFPAVLAAIGLLLPSASFQQSQVFRSTADLVPLFVTAFDKTGVIADLSRDDFQVFDNGKPQPIVLFDTSPQPIRLVVLVDVSGSMEGNLPLFKSACEELVRHLRPGDLAKIGSFGKEISISPTFTRDANELYSALPTAIDPNAPTPLWNAVDRAITELGTAGDGRRVVLVLSDSKDSGPIKFGQKFLSSIEIGERSQREDVMIYGVGIYGTLSAAMNSGAPTLTGMLASTIPDPSLGTLAQNTGGGYIELRGRDNLALSLGRAIDDLHQQYLLGFAPPARDGKTHKIEVKVNRRDVKVRVRKTYVAPK
jgi:Ca-activated chloride channel family protein